MSPTGALGDVPDDKIEDAKAAGFKLMTQDDMQRMHNRLFFAQKFFDQAHPKLTSFRLPRGRGRW